MSQRQALLLSYGALLLVVASCQLVAGVETRGLDPIPSGCTLPSGSGPQVRVANLVPTDDQVDVCIRAAGSSSWGRPIIRDGGTDCPSSLTNGSAGFTYGNVSVAFSAPAASVDIKMIAAGGTCAADALTEADGVSLASNAVTTLIRIGGNAVAQQIVALPEADMADPSSTRLRFVHAMPGTGPLDFGVAKDAHLPTTITSNLLSAPIPFGSTATNQTAVIGVLQDSGYLAAPSLGYQLAAGVDGGSGKAVLVLKIDNRNATYSLYAVGVANDNKHPLRGLLCAENSVAPNPNPLLLPCVGSPLPEISVDVFNPALYGPNAPFEDQRRPVNNPDVVNAIAGRDSDIMCLVEVDRIEDRQKIVSAVQGGPFPNSYMVNTDLSTPITDPTDQSGKTPPAATTPPCGGGVPSADLDALFACLEQSCSTKAPGDATGILQSTTGATQATATDCLSRNCAAPFLKVKADSVACFDCVIDYVASEQTWGTSRNACETDARAPLGFEGQTSQVILSRYPLANSDVFILPSTNYRRAVLYSQVQLEDQTVDVYCGFFISTLLATTIPYNGNYGGGATDTQTAYDNEQLLQASKFAAWVKQKSQGNRPSIIMGEWRASLASSGAMGAFAPPTELDKPTMDLLASSFTLVSAPTWTPQCSYCPQSQNIYNGVDSYFTEQPFLANWPGDTASAVTDESLLFTQSTAQITGIDGGLAPISPYFGLNIRVLRPQQ